MEAIRTEIIGRVVFVTGGATGVGRAVCNALAARGARGILVNSAGRTAPVPVRDLDAITDERWDDLMDTNLRGTFYTCRASAPHLERDGGAIINVGSIGGIRGSTSCIPYGLSKAGCIG